MAVRSSLSPPLMLQKSMPMIKKPANRVVLMLSQSQDSVKKTPPLQMIRSSPMTKIFEDQSEGIVCYRDENGEITCEGYDEGPRLQRHVPILSYHQREERDAEIIDLLQKNWLQIADKGEAGQKDFNCHEFNTLCLYLLALVYQ